MIKWSRTKGFIWNRLTDDWQTYGELFGNKTPTTRTNMHATIERMENARLIEVCRVGRGINLYRLPQPTGDRSGSSAHLAADVRYREPVRADATA